MRTTYEMKLEDVEGAHCAIHTWICKPTGIPIVYSTMYAETINIDINHFY